MTVQRIGGQRMNCTQMIQYILGQIARLLAGCIQAEGLDCSARGGAEYPIWVVSDQF